MNKKDNSTLVPWNRYADFKGHDYAELLEALGFEVTDLWIPDGWSWPANDMQGDALKLANLLHQCLRAILREEPYAFKHKGHYVPTEVCVSLARNFVKSLAESPDAGYRVPLWQGLAQIEDDYTFLKSFIPLLPQAWT